MKLSEYIPMAKAGGNPVLRQRHFTEEGFTKQFGSSPIGQGSVMPTDSTKTLRTWTHEGVPLITKSWNISNEEAQRAVAYELLGRLLADEVQVLAQSLDEIENKDSIFIPGGIGCIGQGDTALVTETCSGQPLNTTHIKNIPTDVRALAAQTILLSTVETFPSSSMLVEGEKQGTKISLIDWESHKKDDPLPDDDTLLVLSWLMRGSLENGDVEKFSQALVAIGKRWNDLLSTNEYRGYLKDRMRREIGEPPLGGIMPSADEIVDHLVESSKFFKSTNFNIWKGVKFDKGIDLQFERELAEMKIKDNQKQVGELYTQLSQLQGNPEDKEPIWTAIQRCGHTVKGSLGIFNDPSLQVLNNAALKVETLGKERTNDCPTLKTAIDELNEEIQKAEASFKERYGIP